MAVLVVPLLQSRTFKSVGFSLGREQGGSMKAFLRLSIGLLVGGQLGLVGCSTPLDLEGVPPVPATPIYDDLIVPGYRIGPVALGLTEAQLLSIKGAPSKSYEGDTTWYVYQSDMNVYVRNIGGVRRIVRVNAEDPRYVTKEGLRYGSSLLELKAKMGPPTSFSAPDAESGYYRYCYSDGIQFQTFQSIVKLITVWSPACAANP
jgi:hypothetical protein